MKLISLNVGMFEKNNPKLQKLFSENSFDIICLQEVINRLDNKTDNEFVSKDPIDEVTQNLEYKFYTPNSILKNFKKDNFHGLEKFEFDLGGFGELGNYTKSKFEISKGQNIFVQNHFTYTTDWSGWPDEDYRSVQVVDFIISQSQKLRIINYHGIWTKDKQGNDLTLSVCSKIKEFASQVGYPVIICGDFNLFPGTPSIKILDDAFINLPDKFNIKTTRPVSNELNGAHRNVIDYIFISNNIEINNFEVVDSDVSDHLPLILDFEIQ